MTAPPGGLAALPGQAAIPTAPLPTAAVNGSAPVEIPAPAGRVGPNAVTRTAEAIDALIGPGVTRAVFARAGLSGYLAEPPAAMVDEREVTRLNAALRRDLGTGTADAVAAEAGRRTADYLLAHRIPRPAQAMLRLLPPGLALRLLMKAVARHSWTFAGSGSFAWRVLPGGEVEVVIRNCPLARHLTGAGAPVCGLYAATFEHLTRRLCARPARCEEVACAADGAEACIFAIILR
ncbi:MAG: bacteriochlorophyll 4-vinyl reductase [Azospirillaceae bacterium]